MKNVQDKKCFHIQRIYPSKYIPWQWKVGDTVRVGASRNYYYDWFYTYCPYYTNINGINYLICEVIEVLSKLFEVCGKDKPKKEEIEPSLYEDFNKIEPLYENIPSILKLTNRGISYITELARELIFEKVRQEKFSDYPSRKTCLFAIPDDEESLDYWKRRYQDEFEGNIIAIYRLSLTGKIHRANTKYLVNKIISLKEYEYNALNYWSGKNIKDSLNDEILFEGEILVEEIL